MPKAKAPPPPADDRPDSPEWTEKRVNDTIRELENLWNPRKGTDKLRLALARGEDTTEAPRPEDVKDLLVDPKILKGRRAMEILDYFVGILAIQSQYSIEAYGVGGEPQLAAEKFGDWLNAYGPATEYESGEDTNLLVTRDALTIGYSAIKTLPYGEDYAKGWPSRERSEDGKRYTEDSKAYSKRVGAYEEDPPCIPIRSSHIPGLTWYPLLHGRKVLKSLEKMRVTAAYVQSKWPWMTSNWGNVKETDEVDYYEIIDGTWCGYYLKTPADKQPQNIRFWRHGVNLPDKVAPVAIFECNKTSDTDLLWRWFSLIESIQGPLEVEDMVLTQMASMFRVTWQPTIMLELMENWSAGLHSTRARERKLKIGGTNIEFKGAAGDSGEKYRYFENPTIPPNTSWLADYANARIAAFLPDALRGDSAAGDSGYKANNDAARAERKLNPIADNFARGDADKARHAAASLKSIAAMQGRPGAIVTIRKATGQGQKKIAVSYPEIAPYLTQVRTQREYVLETDYLMMADAATKFLSDPIRAPRRWVGQNILRWDNPKEMDLERLAEDISLDPAIRDKDIENVLIQIGVKATEEFGMPVEELAAILANGGVLPPGVWMPRTPEEEMAMPQGDGSTITPGGGVMGADAPVVESPAGSSPIGAPMPAPDVRTAAPSPPTQSGRSGQARRQPAQPRAKRTKGTGKS